MEKNVLLGPIGCRFESLGQVIAEWLPRILVALLILIIGRWLLKWIRTLIERLLNLKFVEGIFDRAGITNALASSDQTAAGITATIVYAYLVVVRWLIVFRVLQVRTPSVRSVQPSIVTLLR